MWLLLLTRPMTALRLLANAVSGKFSGKRHEVEVTGLYGKFINLDRFKMDLCHFPLNTVDPSFMNIKTPIAVTIYDIQHEYYPDFFRSGTRELRRRLYRAGAERADVIITISEATKKTLVDTYGIDPAKMVVSYPGCAAEFKKIDRTTLLEEIKNKYHLPDEFIFYPAGTWPHKNHIRLLGAMAILNQRHAFKKTLVLSGVRQNNHDAVLETIERLGLADQVKLLDFVPFSDLPVIYNLATIMVFPSLFEGFGIPLLEAMNTGLSIACSDRTAIPEVVGDAGLYFNPEQEDDIAEKVYRLWQEKDLREALRRKGFERARLFAWQGAIEKTVASYERAAKKAVKHEW
jgi:glycosyltransferase involved in cell wall biosynthesis